MMPSIFMSSLGVWGSARELGQAARRHYQSGSTDCSLCKLQLRRAHERTALQDVVTTGCGSGPIGEELEEEAVGLKVGERGEVGDGGQEFRLEAVVMKRREASTRKGEKKQ